MGHLKHQLAKDDAAQNVQTEFTLLEKEFYDLLKMPSVKSVIMENKKPLYKLIASHGDEVSIFFASDVSFDVSPEISSSKTNATLGSELLEVHF